MWRGQGVHASASPLESLSERRNWLRTALSTDGFAQRLMQSGVDPELLEAWTCGHEPQVPMPGGKRHSLFDLTEGLDQKACVRKCLEAAAATAAAAAEPGQMPPTTPSTSKVMAAASQDVVSVVDLSGSTAHHLTTTGRAEAAPQRRLASPDDVSRICRGVRDGRVLRRQTVLKADHYPSCHNEELPDHISGAPNFRQPSETIPVYGAAMPTMEGLLAVCQRVTASSTQPVVWHNLRQEPCIYSACQYSNPRELTAQAACVRLDFTHRAPPVALRASCLPKSSLPKSSLPICPSPQ